jgi:hypothetical protein
MTARTRKRTSERRKPRAYRESKCSITRRKREPYTCYSSNALMRLRDAWNTRHPSRAITTTSPARIWAALKLELGNACNSEACWLRQSFARHKLPSDVVAYTFAPTAPAVWKDKPSEWLTSDEIAAAMQHLEVAVPSFAFFGPSPIDFDKRMAFGQCVWSDICQIEVKKLHRSGTTKLGFVFNTDPHTKPGEHWVALYADLDAAGITYMDSYGDPAPPEVLKLVARLKQQMGQLGVAAEFREIRRRHQLGESECGMYCLHFLTTLARGDKTPIEFERERIPDMFVKRLRGVYFNKEA